jgi:branched-chain amino acid transport system substrate-binding protein
MYVHPKRVKLLAGLAALALIGTACSSGNGTTDPDPDPTSTSTDGGDGNGDMEIPDNPDEGVTATTIKLGWMGDSTGPTASAQGFNLLGMQAAVAWYNEQGGVLGRQLQLVDKDDQFNAEVAATNYASLIRDERVLALLGMGGAHISGALMPNVEEDQIPLIGPPQTIDPQLPNPYVFNNIAHYGDQADVAVPYMASIVGSLDDLRVVVIQLELPSGDEWDEYIKVTMEEQGGTYVDRILLAPAGADFPGAVTRLRQLIANEGVNFVAFHGAPGHGLGIVTEMASQGVDIPIVGIHGIAGSTIYQEGPAGVADRVKGIHSFTAVNNDCEICGDIMDFVAGTQWEDATTEINFAHGWLNVRIAVQAIERAAEMSGEVSRATLTEALQAGPFDTGGLSCPIDWSDSRHSPCAAPMQWIDADGRIEPFMGFEEWRQYIDGVYGL